MMKNGSIGTSLALFVAYTVVGNPASSSGTGRVAAFSVIGKRSNVLRPSFGIITAPEDVSPLIISSGRSMKSSLRAELTSGDEEGQIVAEDGVRFLNHDPHPEPLHADREVNGGSSGGIPSLLEEEDSLVLSDSGGGDLDESPLAAPSTPLAVEEEEHTTRNGGSPSSSLHHSADEERLLAESGDSSLKTSHSEGDHDVVIADDSTTTTSTAVDEISKEDESTLLADANTDIKNNAGGDEVQDPRNEKGTDGHSLEDHKHEEDSTSSSLVAEEKGAGGGAEEIGGKNDGAAGAGSSSTETLANSGISEESSSASDTTTNHAASEGTISSGGGGAGGDHLLMEKALPEHDGSAASAGTTAPSLPAVVDEGQLHEVVTGGFSTSTATKTVSTADWHLGDPPLVFLARTTDDSSSGFVTELGGGTTHFLPPPSHDFMVVDSVHDTLMQWAADAATDHGTLMLLLPDHFFGPL